MKTLLFLIGIFCFGDSWGQSINPAPPISFDSLRKRYGVNKMIPEEYELSILLALTYFPELETSSIKFVNKHIKTTLNARPTVASLFFRSKKKRKYVVRINTDSDAGIVLLDEVPMEAQMGLFGHEFTHFVDYSQRNFFGVMGRMFSYMGKKSKARFEKEIDVRTIKRGLGEELYAWASFVLKSPSSSEEYKTFKRLIYLEPDEILVIMKAMKLY